jgi:hypothetical protein
VYRLKPVKGVFSVGATLVYLYLISHKRKKLIVAEIVVIEHKVVVGISHHRIPVRLIQLLDLLWSIASVAYICVTVKICFIKIAFLR